MLGAGASQAAQAIQPAGAISGAQASNSLFFSLTHPETLPEFKG